MPDAVVYRCPSCQAYATVGLDVPLDHIIICGVCQFRARVWWMRGLPKPETHKEETVTEPTDGLEPSKYRVERMGDHEGKHDACWYFVLDPHHDQYAVNALRAYASSAQHAYPALASELRDVVQQYERHRVWGVRRASDGHILPSGATTQQSEREARDLLILAQTITEDPESVVLVYRDLPDGEWTRA